MKAFLADPKTLHRNPWNSNHVAPANMLKLRKSIEDLGFNTAVVVRELADGTLQILGGQHRTEVAREIGLKSIPVINLGPVDDKRAKMIGLADNSRYGSDDSLQLAAIIEELQMDNDLASFLPIQNEDLQAIMRAVDIDLDKLDVLPEDDEGEETREPTEERAERPVKTHEMMTFRVTVREAEAIRTKIEKTIKKEGLDDGSDDKTLAGSALAYLLLTGE
jgi:ParB family chromosome partitioning protein